MYCIHCGEKQSEGARYCFSCGKEIFISSTYERNELEEELHKNNVRDKAVHSTVEVPMTDDELLVQYVGKYKRDYYLGKWLKGGITWNWAAFFLTVFWVGYRRMYGFIIGLFTFYILIDLTVQLLAIESTAIDVGIGVALSLFLGMNGNNMYENHAKRKLKKLKRKYGEKAGAILKISSGPSWGGFWLGVLAYTVYGVITFAVFYIPPISEPEPKSFYTTVEEYDEPEDVVEVNESGTVSEEAEDASWDDMEDEYYHELVAPSVFDFSVSKEVDINFDGTYEVVTLNGGPVLDDPYVNSEVYISVRLGDEEWYVNASSGDESILRLYDINGDGWLELLYEHSEGETLIDIFQVGSGDLEFVRALPGRLVELDTNRIMTDSGEFLFEDWWWE
ncbi:DUF2628 domain-containing protein [Paucisalibacillus sp. EB02]|uniref:DUF2628 domain-containing protein n=1 Tax=Paucisalibacillus sp. EB02 TaxID=1347087 RepID=UPI0004BCA007|nr:DUF2628 domain-containing protein [Paucisalibacillus sp. EB02]